MNALIFFDMFGNVLGNYVVVSKKITKKGRDFFAMLGSCFFHKSDFAGRLAIWGR